MSKLNVLAALAILAAPLSAQAADGTITFTGSVTDRTCQITAGGDIAVVLPTVSRSSLATAGATAGRTPFSINLTACSPGSVSAYFEPGQTVDLSTGRLNNQVANGAENVQIQLLGEGAEFVPVLPGQQDNAPVVIVDNSGNAELEYHAEYYANGAATAGAVSTSIQYTINYN